MLAFLFCLLLGVPQWVWADAATDDYTARKTAAGVIFFTDFDNTTTDIVESGPNKNCNFSADGTCHAHLDTAIKRSGIGSMRFDVPAPPHYGEGMTGTWSDQWASAIGAGQTIYVQFAIRWSPWMIDNVWPLNNSWKINRVCYNNCPCGNLQLVLGNWNQRDIPHGYHTCGQDKSFISKTSDWFAHESIFTVPYMINAHDFNCSYSNWNTTGTCFYYKPNIWHTITEQFTINAWGAATGEVKIQIWTEKVPVNKTVIDITDFTFICDTMPTCINEGYNKVEFDGAYMTNLSGFSGLPYPAHVFIDELIVSTSPIPPPSVAPSSEGTQMIMTGGRNQGGGGILR